MDDQPAGYHCINRLMRQSSPNIIGYTPVDLEEAIVKIWIKKVFHSYPNPNP